MSEQVSKIAILFPRKSIEEVEEIFNRTSKGVVVTCQQFDMSAICLISPMVEPIPLSTLRDLAIATDSCARYINATFTNPFIIRPTSLETLDVEDQFQGSTSN